MATKIKRSKGLKQQLDNATKLTGPQAQVLIQELLAVNKQLKYTTDAMMTELADRDVKLQERLAVLEEAILGMAGEVVDPRNADAVKRCILSQEMREKLGVQVEEIKAQKLKEAEMAATAEGQDECTDADSVEEQLN